MVMSPEEMREKWKKARITNEGLNDIRKEIKDSWSRSIQKNVSPFIKANPVIIAAKLLEQKRNEYKELLDVSTPIIQNIFEFIKGSGFVAALSDCDGILLYVLGDEEGMEFTRRANFIEGAKWSEDVIGTNAVSLSLTEKKPVQVYGYEHFCICAYNSTCSAAPIRNPEEKVIGVLDITGPFEKVHYHTLGIVVAGVNAIENQLIIRKNFRENILAHQYKTFIMDSISEGIFSTDNYGLITHINRSAASILQAEPQAAINQNIAKLIDNTESNHYFINLVRSKRNVTDIPITISRNNQKIKCTVSCTQLADLDDRPLGRVVILQDFQRINKLVHEITGSHAKIHFNDIIGKSNCFMDTLRIARAVAASDCNVLLLGESGTGKDMFAQAIHNASIRAKQPFIAINCAALPKELITSELFGYDEGAFTGARKGGNPGKFELADQGTIFLDEIGEMPMDTQATLLRVLEEQLIMRVGGKEYLPVNVRVIASTNRDLAQEVNKNSFRRDLYYRLKTMAITLPPLRERKDDVYDLIDHFIKKASSRIGKNIEKLDSEALNILLNYPWPGNIRELQNVIEHAIILSSSPVINKELLPAELISNSSINPAQSSSLDSLDGKDSYIRNIEKQAISDYLAKYGNKKIVAKQLGISRSTLYRKMREYRID